jgi:hypothetical protein
MRTERRNRCDQILELIDRCLADCDAAPPTDTTTTASQGDPS